MNQVVTNKLCAECSATEVRRWYKGKICSRCYMKRLKKRRKEGAQVNEHVNERVYMEQWYR